MSKIKPHRTSIFREEGLDDLNRTVHSIPDGDKKFLPVFEFEDVKRKHTKFDEPEEDAGEDKENSNRSGPPWFSRLGKGSRPKIKSSATGPPGSFSSIPRVALIACLIAVVLPGFRYGGEDKVNISGADAGVIREAELVENASAIEGRANSPTAVCTRWSHQSMLKSLLPFSKLTFTKVANVNGTVYIYGGQATTQSGQTENVWSKLSHIIDAGNLMLISL